MKEKAPNKGSKTYWLCVCDCGVEKPVQTSHLRSGVTTSCGQNICPYHKNGFFQDDTEKVCPICNKSFITSNKKRKYCYDCKPEGSKTNGIEIYRKAIKKKLVELKGGKCAICGYDKSLRALTFHHRNKNEKLFSISSATLHTLEEYLEEIEKCDLLCANCHAELHEHEDNEE